MRIENLRRDGKEEVGERALIKTRITRDESREMATDTVATFTTKLTLFHSIRILLARLVRFARPSLKMRLASLAQLPQLGIFENLSPPPPPTTNN